MILDDGLDVIGDVHGEYDALVALLTKLGYEERGGAWRHPGRRAVFVGDLIDRGPKQVEVVTLVRRMHDAGTALVIMGNHEFNALAWATEKPGDPGTFLRNHETKFDQHEAFLHQVGDGKPRHHEYLRWFATLPMWLDLPGLRVVHACWQPTHVKHLTDRTNSSLQVTYDLLVGAHDKPREAIGTSPATEGSADYWAIETTLKGIEVRLPNGMSFLDKEGKKRSKARIMWWSDVPRTYRKDSLVGDDDVRDQLPEDDLPELEADDDDRPIVFGHYWNNGNLKVQAAKAVCVDYSATLGGSLVAYRWSGEKELSDSHLVGVPGRDL